MRMLRPTIPADHRAKITAGVRRAKRKCSDAIAADIRSSTESRAVLAERHGLHPSYVWAIRAGKAWRETVANSSIFSLARSAA